MSKKPELAKSGNRGGYKITRDEHGFTERQRLDRIRAERQEFQHAIEKGLFVHRDDVIAERRQVAAVLGSDLMSLGGRLSSRLVRKNSPAAVKTMIDQEVCRMMKRWQEGGVVNEREAGPENKKKPAKASKKRRKRILG